MYYANVCAAPDLWSEVNIKNDSVMSSLTEPDKPRCVPYLIGLEKFVKSTPIVVTELSSCLAQLNNELARFGGVFWQAGCHITI